MIWKSDRHSLLVCVVLSGIAALLPAGELPANDLSPDAVRTHLHIHALSNHNGGNLPASIQWHVSQAAEFPGDDFIWWTEHCELFRENPGRSIYALGFDQFFKVEGSQQFRLEKSGRILQRIHSLWDYDTQGNASIDIESGAATLALFPGEQPSRITLEPRSKRGTIRLNWLTRAISVRPVVRLVFRDLHLPPGARLTVRCYLSYLWENSPVQPRLDFVLRNEKSPQGERGVTRETMSVETPVSVAPLVNRIELDLAGAASLLPELAEHTISRLELVAENESADTMIVSLEQIEIVNPPVNFPRFRRELRETYRTYEAEYDVMQKMGMELRFTGMKDHFCIYASEQLREDWFADYPRSECDAVLAGIHEGGGFYSLAHAFGTQSHRDADRSPSARRDSIRDKVFTRLRENSVFGADFLEIGYWNRGNALLEDYILLWDALAASGHPLVGIGASDAHGGVWARPTGTSSWWATWVYGPPDAASILDSLLSGRAYVGDVTLWDGQLDLALDGSKMGDRIPFTAGEHSVTVNLSPPRDDFEVHLTILPLGQEIERTADLIYTMKSERVPSNTAFKIDLGEPSLVRAEVYETESGKPGRIVALSNPIWVGAEP